MKKAILGLLVVFVLASACYAQVAREPDRLIDSKTNVTYLGIQGSNVDGNPGFLEMNGISTLSGTNYQYYLWVDETGDLCMASGATISAFSSFPTGNWNATNMPVCTKVGGQS